MKSKLFIKITAVIVLVVTAIMLSSCAVGDTPVTDEMFALDTVISFTVYGDSDTAHNAIDKAKSEISRLEKLFSVTVPSSDIGRINSSNGKEVAVSAETVQLINRAIEVSDTLNGALDISIRPLVSLWGFDTKSYTVPTDEEVSKALENVDYKQIKISNTSVKVADGMSLDLGAVAKGYIADRVVAVLTDNSVTSAIVNLGGNVVAVGTKPSAPFKIGIEYPTPSGDTFAIVDKFSGVAVTSGAYQRYFEQYGVVYHHIIDPKTGRPSNSDISSVTVFSDDSTMADALSTAFFVVGIDKTIEYCKQHHDIGVAVLDSSKTTLYVTPDVNSRLTLTNSHAEISIKEIK